MAALGEIDDEPQHRARLVRRLDEALAAAFAQARQSRARRARRSRPLTASSQTRSSATRAAKPPSRRTRSISASASRLLPAPEAPRSSTPRSPTSRAVAWIAPRHGQAGRLTTKRAPAPWRGASSSSSAAAVAAPGGKGRFSAQSRPEWACTIWREIERPRPEFSPEALARDGRCRSARKCAPARGRGCRAHRPRRAISTCSRSSPARAQRDPHLTAGLGERAGVVDEIGDDLREARIVAHDEVIRPAAVGGGLDRQLERDAVAARASRRAWRPPRARAGRRRPAPNRRAPSRRRAARRRKYRRSAGRAGARRAA